MSNDTIAEGSVYEYDHQREVEKFDNTKLGVKGLVDAGITSIPRIFQHPPETLFGREGVDSNDSQSVIPVIDMSGTHQDVVDRIREASSTVGFFQLINHGVPVSLLDRLLDAIKGFFELPAEEKIRYYSREQVATGVGFYSNYDLFHSKAASWRDTLQIELGPVCVDPSLIPEVCRDEMMEWEKEVKKLGQRVVGLLSEGLGLSANRLERMPFMLRVNMGACHYPYCPEPNKTVGLPAHTDPGFLTVLLQDQVGGLQVKSDGKWIDLKPIHGAIVINLGDLFQIVSNDEYKSGEHRVLANPFRNPRVSIPIFFNAADSEDFYGPLPELITQEKPALYREFKSADIMRRFLMKELAGKDMVSYFRL